MIVPEVRDQRSEVRRQASGAKCQASGARRQAPSAALLAIHNSHSALRTPRSGVALILTLGLLTVITLAVVAFVVTMRIEHLAASNAVHRTIARQYVDVGLSEAMGVVDYVLSGSASNSPSTYPVQGWFDTNSVADLPTYHFQEKDCLGLPTTNSESPIQLFRGSVTNLLPGTLAAQASQVWSGWVDITETNAATGNAGIQAGRVSFLIVNLSGMMDVHALNADRHQALGEPNNAYTLLGAATNGNYNRVFLTQPDLTAANNGAVSNLVTFSYDPGPDVFFTNLTLFGTRSFSTGLCNRFNINLATNESALATVSNLLADAGVIASDQVAWNILNYIDSGRIPIGPTPQTFRSGYCVKDVPLINKVLLDDPASNQNYSVAVELWYPFVPNSSPPSTHLWVGIYTNAEPDTTISPATADFTIDCLVPTMAYAGSNEFFVARMAGSICFQRWDNVALKWVTDPIGQNGHQVWIWPRVLVDGICVDEALVTGGTVANWTSTGCIQFADPRANNTQAGATTYAAATPALGTNNANCTIPSLPLVLADAPMRSAGELRYIYAPGMPGNRIDFTTQPGGACRDRFTVLGTNAPVHGLVQANTPYTNIWQALLSDVTVGWSNQVSNCIGKIDTNSDTQALLAYTVANALLNSGGRGWVCNKEMFPLVGSNLLSSAMATNNVGGGMDARAVCGDILAGIADRVTYRGNTFLVIVCGQRLSPLGRVLADQRDAITVVRDAYTGRWVVDHVVWLTE